MTRPNAFAKILFAFTVLLGLSAMQPAVAQFNGPALPPGTGVNRPTSVTTDPAILYPATRNVQLSTGDLISVKVLGSADYIATVRLDVEGKVQLPLIGLTLLQGLTLPQAETAIASALVAAGMFRDPQVAVLLVEGPGAVASVVGEAHGIIPIVGQRRLLDVLTGAGGLPATASHVITINRPGVADPIVVDLGTDPAHSSLANIPIFGGDTIIVARVGVVYVLGAFKTQGIIPVAQNTPLTLLQVTALSGGPNFEGNYSDLRIIRTVGTQRTLVKLDIKKVMYGKAPDPVLQADDIIFLPPSAFKTAIQSGGIGTVLGIVSLAIVAFR